MDKYTRAAAAAMLAILASTPAQARTIHATLIVSATVVQSCSTVTASNLGFGSYVSGGRAVDGQAEVSVTCSNGTPYTVKLNTESGAGAMKLGSNALRYTLYQNPEHSRPWNGADAVPASKIGTSAPQTHMVYGRILPSQEVPAGPYFDTVSVTVSF